MAGGTIHWINEGIDSGNIINRAEFPITEEDTSISIFQKTQEALYKSFNTLLPDIISGNIESISQTELIEKGYESNYYNRNSLNGLKEISFSEMSSKEIMTHVRAFDFPGHEPAWTLIRGKKVYLTTLSFFEYPSQQLEG